MLDAWGIGVLSQSLARVSNTRFFFYNRPDARTVQVAQHEKKIVKENLL
jgi:hypothetical protein